MKELLQTLVEQNAEILATLERMAEKLDVLDDIRLGIESTDRSTDTIMDSIRSIEGELQWTNNISAVAQIIQSVDYVAAAIHEQT